MVREIAEGRRFVAQGRPSHQIRYHDGQLYQTLDSGTSWNNIASPLAAEPKIAIAFHPDDPFQMLLVTDALEAAYYDGDSWWPILLPGDARFEPGSLPPIAFQSGDDGMRFWIGARDGVYIAEHTDDGEESASIPALLQWQRLATPALPVTALATSASGDLVAVGYESGVVLVLQVDPETGLELVSETVIYPRRVTALSFHPLREGELLAAYGGASDDADAPGLASTEDAGGSWEAAKLPAHEPQPKAITGLFHLSNGEEPAAVLVFEDAIYRWQGENNWLRLDGESVPDYRSPERYATCRYSVAPATVNISAERRQVAFAVNANSSTCAWRVSYLSSRTNLKVLSGSSGRGDGRVVIEVAANTSSRSRTLSLTIANNRLRIVQAGITTTTRIELVQGIDDLGRLDGTIGAEGGRFRVRVTTSPANAAWRFEADSRVIRFSPVSGKGDRTIQVQVLRNTGANSRDILTKLAGQSYKLVQGGKDATEPNGGGLLPPSPAACAVLSARPLTVESSGGSVVVDVRVTSQCGGSVLINTDQNFVELPVATLSNSQKLTLNLSQNPTASARQATIRVQGKNGGLVQAGTISIVQRGAVVPPANCQLTLTATPTQFSAAGGSGTLNVTSIGSCSGTLTFESETTFLTVTANPLGVIGEPRRFTVSANPGANNRNAQIIARLGTVRSNAVTITQAGQTAEPAPVACTFSVPSVIEIAGGQTQAFINVTASRPDCAWQVGSLATLAEPRTWARPTSGTYTGTRQVLVTISPGPLQTRMGFVQVAGRSVTLIQNGSLPSNGCSPNIGSRVGVELAVGNNPTSARGGDGVFRVNAPSGCEYLIHLTGDANVVELLDPARGVSNGSQRFRILPNTSGSPRQVTFYVQLLGPGQTPPAQTLRQLP